MQRYFVELSYNGASFFGWQRQPNQISVQEEIENAFTKLNSNNSVVIVGCGRTDAGVHANHYVLHVDLKKGNTIDHLIFKLNRILPASIVIHSIYEVSFDMHARFNACSRTYRYFMNSKKDPFKQGLSWTFLQELNFEANKCFLKIITFFRTSKTMNYRRKGFSFKKLKAKPFLTENLTLKKLILTQFKLLKNNLIIISLQNLMENMG